MAQIGAREHYAIATELQRRGLLRQLVTDYWSSSRAASPSWSTWLRALRQRRTHGIPDALVASHNVKTLVGRAVRSLRRWESPYATFLREGHEFASRIAAGVKRLATQGEAGCFFGYTTGALEVMQHLRGSGTVCILDQIDPSLVEERIVQRERAEFPEWEPEARPIPAAYHQRTREEWALADIIVVNSRWSWSALKELGVPEQKLFVLPLHFRPSQSPPPEKPRDRCLRVVWAGSVTLRKGIQYLAQAAEQLLHRPIEIRVAGNIHVNPRMIARLPRNMQALGRITRQEMREVYAWGDVYVLPTLSDGFAITQLEAMAHGLPVITTDRCGEVVEHGRSGFIVPARSATELAAAIECVCDDRGLLRSMSRGAWVRAQAMCNEVFPRRFDALVERVDLAGPSDVPRG